MGTERNERSTHTEEATEEHSDGRTRTSGSNAHMEQHGSPLDGRGTFGWGLGKPEKFSIKFRSRLFPSMDTDEKDHDDKIRISARGSASFGPVSPR